jgi:hypothetical protein
MPISTPPSGFSLLFFSHKIFLFSEPFQNKNDRSSVIIETEDEEQHPFISTHLSDEIMRETMHLYKNTPNILPIQNENPYNIYSAQKFYFGFY